MRCPTCGFDNLLGSDICDNCGSDLAGHDTPQSATTFRGRLLGERLDRLRIAPPEIVDASADVDDAIRRMHDKGIDCVLVVEAGRLVGIFTDRDAVLKVAGTKSGGKPISAVMTHDPVVLRHDETGAAVARRQHEHRQPFEGHRPVARQVVEIRPDPDEERIQAVLGGRGHGPLESLPVAFGRDRRAGGSRHRVVSVGRAAVSQRVIVAGPSSNSLR